VTLPPGCDVAVIGGGLAGLLAADRLQRAGAAVVLVEGVSGPSPATDRSLGIVGLGWIDSPARLVSGLGETTARGLHAWSALAIESLVATAVDLGVPIERTGSWRVSLDDLEAVEWRESARLLAAWGLADARECTTEERDRLTSGGATGAVFVPGDGLADVPAITRSLRARFLSAGGVAVRGDARLDDVAGAPLVRLGAGELRCELAVVAAGASAPSVHPFFASCVYPVRVQGLRLAAQHLPRAPEPAPVIARHRFEAWHRDRDGGLRFVGCRWGAQPEMEAGVTDDEALSDGVSRAQDGFLASHLGVRAEAPRERWAGIVAYTCDGLPLLGPLPGAPKVLALLGWAGWGMGLMARAVDEITAAVLGEPPPDGAGTPRWLQARRLL
jgi:glycine/D-amino acid oxidase-like deaminating enzyme